MAFNLSSLAGTLEKKAAPAIEMEATKLAGEVASHVAAAVHPPAIHPAPTPPSPQPKVGGLGGALRDILHAATKPAIPELAERGTAEAPTVLVNALNRGLPVRRLGGEELAVPTIDDAVDRQVSMTYDPKRTMADRVRDVKTFVLGAFDPVANAPSDIKAHIVDAKTRRNASESIAAHDIASQLAPLLDGNLSGPQARELAASRFSKVGKQFLIADTIAQMDRDGIDTLNGIHIDRWRDANEKLLAEINNNPGMRQASVNIRAGLDDLFNSMVKDGLIDENRYMEDYAMRRGINTVIGHLAEAQGIESDALRAKILSTTKSRGEISSGTVNESNFMHLLMGARAEYYKVMADRKLAKSLFSDPTIEFSRHFKQGDTLPVGLTAYNPGRGDFGYDSSDPDKALVAESLNMLDPEGRAHGGFYILPTELVKKLKNYHPAPHHEMEDYIVRAGRAMAKNLTVYNPANTNLNRFSDAFVAMMGLPGEKADPIGFLRFYGPSGEAAAKFVRGEKNMVMLGKQKIDITELIAREGLAESTVAADLSGNKISQPLTAFLPESERGSALADKTLGAMQRERARVELTPRIAAGWAAVEKSGRIEDFGRVAKQITLNFGSGSPELAQVPLLRFISPFLTFTGLAAERTFKLATTPGSRARTLMMLAAIPTSTMMWNNQNEEYRRVERSISSRDQDQLHVIVPDFKNPGMPLYDYYGKPVIWRVRYFVPEEMMKLVGLGNLPSRILRAAEGRTTAIELAKGVPEGVVKSISDLATIPAIASEFVGGKTAEGRELSVPDRILRVMPALRIASDAYNAYESEGKTVKEKVMAAARVAAERTAGLSFINPRHKFGVPMDADLAEQSQKVAEAKKKYDYAKLHGPANSLDKYLQAYLDEQKKYEQIAKVYMAQSKNNPAYSHNEIKANPQYIKDIVTGARGVVEDNFGE